MILIYGLVLQGGGARGAYHIGACQAIKELGIELGGVAGTSAGALNGAMIAQGDQDKAYEVWYNMSPSRVLAVDEEQLNKLVKLDINTDNIPYFLNRVKEIVKDGGLDISPLRAMLEANIDEQKLRRSEMDFGLVTIALTDMKAVEIFKEDIPEGKVVDYLIASSSLPAFKNNRIEGKLFLDGGFYDNLPINLLASRGYQKIIAVKTGFTGRIRKVHGRKLDIIYINPSENLGKVMDFNQHMARRNLKMGYFDTLKAFKGLKGKKFYLSNEGNEELIYDYLLNISEERVKAVGKLFGLRGIPYKRMLFEHIIPNIAAVLNLNDNASYEDIAVAFLEEIASKYKVDRYKLYDLNSFLLAIADKYSPHRERVLSELPELLRHSKLLSRVAKEEIFDEMLVDLFADKLQ